MPQTLEREIPWRRGEGREKEDKGKRGEREIGEGGERERENLPNLLKTMNKSV